MSLREILEYPIITLNAKEGAYFTVFNLVLIVFIILTARVLMVLFRRFLYRRMRATPGFDEGRLYSVTTIFKYSVYFFTSIFILMSSGIDLTLLVAAVTALLVGVGFGLQHTFNDFFSGIIILFEGTMHINDVVEVDGIVGKVVKIGLRATEVESRDGTFVIMPNSKFTSQGVVNWSHNSHLTRFCITVFVAYGSEAKLVRATLEEVASRHAEVAKSPSPSAWLAEFADSGIRYELYFWSTNNFFIEKTKSDIRYAVEDAFRQKDVRIPFPQRDIHIRSMPGSMPGNQA